MKNSLTESRKIDSDPQGSSSENKERKLNPFQPHMKPLLSILHEFSFREEAVSYPSPEVTFSPEMGIID